jgi:hypothetical protein
MRLVRAHLCAPRAEGVCRYWLIQHTTTPKTAVIREQELIGLFRRGARRQSSRRRRRARVTSLLGRCNGPHFHEGLIRPHGGKHCAARRRLCRPRSGRHRGGSWGGSRGGDWGGGDTALGEGTVHRPGVARLTMLQFRDRCGLCSCRTWRRRRRRWPRRPRRWQDQWWRQRCGRFGGKVGPTCRCTWRGAALARPVLLRQGSVLCGQPGARLLPWSRCWLPRRVRACRRRSGGQGSLLARRFLAGSGARTDVRVRRGEVVQHARCVRCRMLGLVPTHSDL